MENIKSEQETGKESLGESTLEQSFEELEGLIGRLGEPDVSLDESFALYEKGMKLIRSCNEKLDQVEKKMLCITGEGELTEF